MRQIIKNKYGSIVPLFIALALIFFSGLIISILGMFVLPIMDTSNNINNLMSKIWLVVIPITILFVLIFYAIVRGQRGGQI